MMKSISTGCNLSKTYTNHSVRATTISFWSDAQMPIFQTVKSPSSSGRATSKALPITVRYRPLCRWYCFDGSDFQQYGPDFLAKACLGTNHKYHNQPDCRRRFLLHECISFGIFQLLQHWKRPYLPGI